MRPEVSLTKLDLYRLRQKNEDKTHFGPEMDRGRLSRLSASAAKERRWRRPGSTTAIALPRRTCRPVIRSYMKLILCLH